MSAVFSGGHYDARVVEGCVEAPVGGDDIGDDRGHLGFVADITDKCQHLVPVASQLVGEGSDRALVDVDEGG